MICNYEKIQNKLLGRTIDKPISGTLSGHAAGEPFDKLVYKIIKEDLPNFTYRQYEYLNDLYSKNPNVIGHKARAELFDSPTVLFLLSRGKNATDKWSLDNPFDEKQNDTADILIVQNGFYEILDVKTRNISKSAQAPNIISAYKLAQVCAKMIDNNEFDNFTINYLEIDWVLENDKLICKNTHVANLFKANPYSLYINWAAAMQIQFHICDLDQEFIGNKKAWCREYIRNFVNQAKRRSDDMIKKFVIPFEQYL